jgi:hypothetical protein
MPRTLLSSSGGQQTWQVTDDQDNVLGTDTVPLVPNAQPAPSLSGPVLAKSPSNPVFEAADATGFDTIYWPWVLRVDQHLSSPLGRYYLWFSTNHAGANGKIGLAYSDSPTGPFTFHAQVYQDATSGTETETPSVVWVPEESLFFLYYQQSAPDGAIASQVTCLATSPDGVTWTRVGIVADVPVLTQWPSPAHTGYFRPFRVGAKWYAYSLLRGGNLANFALWHSYDGRAWQPDPRPLGNGHEYLDGTERIEWNTGAVVELSGRLWWIGNTSDFTSGGGTKVNRVVAAPLAGDLRSWIGPPVEVIEPTEAWETTNYNAGGSVLIDDKVHLYYHSNADFGVAVG